MNNIRQKKASRPEQESEENINLEFRGKFEVTGEASDRDESLADLPPIALLLTALVLLVA